jgi:hypothetical protein
MATRNYNIGSEPPQIQWTIVRGDTAAFKVYVTDDSRVPLDISEWSISADFRQENSVVVSTTPAVGIDDGDGEFTVSLTSAQTEVLETGDVFDIQLSDDARVWTVAQGRMVVIEDVTD